MGSLCTSTMILRDIHSKNVPFHELSINYFFRETYAYIGRFTLKLDTISQSEWKIVINILAYYSEAEESSCVASLKT